VGSCEHSSMKRWELLYHWILKNDSASWGYDTDSAQTRPVLHCNRRTRGFNNANTKFDVGHDINADTYFYFGSDILTELAIKVIV
jgi:hypothetical protein